MEARGEELASLGRDRREVLTEWFWAHFMQPTPRGATKEALARAAAMTVQQVVDWFTNAKMRKRKKIIQQLADEMADEIGVCVGGGETG